MRFRVASKTDTGRARSRNEDSLFAELPLVAVADGMGGHRGGDVASQAALEVLARRKDRLAGADDPGDELRQAFHEANDVVFAQGRDDQALEGMGTTLTAAWLDGSRATLAHVGDSRAYLLRSGDLQQITEDQTLVHEWEKQGKLTADEAAISPQRNILLQAIGGDPATLHVDVSSVELRPGDRLLLASDGLHSMVPENDRIRDILLANEDPEAATQALIDAANEAGGQDNITVIVLDAVGDGSAAAAPDVTEAHTPVVISKAAPKPPARDGDGRLRRALIVVGGAFVVVVALVAFLALRAANTGLLVAARGERVVVLDGQPGTGGRPATGTVVRRFRDRLEDFPRPYQRQLRAGIPVSSLEEAEQVVDDLPRALGPEQTPAPTPSASSSPTAPPVQTLPPASRAP